MDSITCDKATVLAALKENRDKHHSIFEEAVEGYRREALLLLEQHIEAVKSGKRSGISIELSAPADRTRDYDRAIRMLELSMGDLITLSENDVKCFIMDDWNWKHQFLASNSHYSATAAAAYLAD